MPIANPSNSKLFDAISQAVDWSKKLYRENVPSSVRRNISDIIDTPMPGNIAALGKGSFQIADSLMDVAPKAGPALAMVLNPNNMNKLYAKLVQQGIDPKSTKGAFQFIQDKNPNLRAILRHLRLVKQGRTPNRLGLYVGSENTGAVYENVLNYWRDRHYPQSPQSVANTTAHEIMHGVRQQRGKVDNETIAHRAGQVGQDAYKKFLDYLVASGLVK